MAGTLARIGLWLLVAGGITVIAEVVLAVPMALRVRRLVRQVEALSASGHELELGLRRLRRATAETGALWRPWRRAWRRVRHPLVLALLASWRRRRRTARAARAGLSA